MAQVYPRIANPFQPNGTPNLTNSPSPFQYPGELGCSFNDQSTGGSYLRVQLDSGATSATAVGAVAAGQLAFWKNRATSTVTNDKNQAQIGPTGAVNEVAGIFQLAVSATPNVNGTDGNPQLYMCDLVIQKAGYPVQISGAATLGGYASANTAANTANVVASAVGTSAPTQPIGIITSATVTNNTVPVDVNVGFID